MRSPEPLPKLQLMLVFLAGLGGRYLREPGATPQH